MTWTLVTGASGASGNGYGAVLSFTADGALAGRFSNDRGSWIPAVSASTRPARSCTSAAATTEYSPWTCTRQSHSTGDAGNWLGRFGTVSYRAGMSVTLDNEAYAALQGRGLELDLTRGKPSAEQLDLITFARDDDCRAADGTDCRNYGGLQGLPELREIFSGFLQVPAAQLVALGNSSLTLMHDIMVHALLFPLPGSSSGWLGHSAFLCPVPGYDRHFAVCEKFGIEMIQVPMLPDGPDMNVVEELVAGDPRIKGMWCVPKYSNPTGACYSSANIERLARMRTAAGDFRLFWDNAYAVHSLTPDGPAQIAPVLDACERAGNGDRAFVFGSTSKITYPGAGVAFFGSSPANVSWFLGHLAKQTIGPDKVNQLRHVRLLRSADGVLELMDWHRQILAPKFALVDEVLRDGLGGIASWTLPAGGYFMCLDVPDGCAATVVRLAADAGIALTPAGATHPYGRDPHDRTIRLAPTFPSLTDLEQAMRGLVTCVRLAAGGPRAAAYRLHG
jgi:DNA-binding transcriptional MocR family regulator